MRQFRNSKCEIRIGATVVFAIALAVSLAAVPLVAEAQSPAKPPKVGLLFLGVPEAKAPDRAAVFREGLRERKWIEGENVLFEYRYASGNLDRAYPYEQLESATAELVQQRVAVIVAFGQLPTWAARRVTTAVPIVMVAAEDPVENGLVVSLARPGGNITGLALSVLDQDLDAKRLELLKATLPALSRVAVGYSLTGNVQQTHQLIRMEAAAPALGVEIRRVGLMRVEDLDRTFARLQRDRIGALRIQSDPVTDPWCGRIAELAIKRHLPTMFDSRSCVEAGGLMSYAPNLADMDRRAATYVDKILKGAKPSDLPVEQPTKFELAVNLKTAKALGLTIPQSVLIRADEVIR